MRSRRRPDRKTSQDVRSSVLLTWGLRSDDTCSLPAATCITWTTLATPPLSWDSKGALYHKFAGTILGSRVRDGVGPLSRGMTMGLAMTMTMTVAVRMRMRMSRMSGRMARNAGAGAVTVHGRDLSLSACGGSMLWRQRRLVGLSIGSVDLKVCRRTFSAKLGTIIGGSRVDRSIDPWAVGRVEWREAGRRWPGSTELHPFTVRPRLASAAAPL